MKSGNPLNYLIDDKKKKERNTFFIDKILCLKTWQKFG